MALSTAFTQCAQETTEFGKITENKGYFKVQGHRFWYQSKAHIRLPIIIISYHRTYYGANPPELSSALHR